MKLLVFSLLALILLFSGCNEPQESAYYKGIESALVSSECADSKDDVCGLFDCMTDLCWCYKGPDQVLFEGSTVVASEAEAMQAVSKYISDPYATPPQGIVVERAVEINSIFYNVFVTYADGNEEVLTVAVDGTIIKTICGV